MLLSNENQVEVEKIDDENDLKFQIQIHLRDEHEERRSYDANSEIASSCRGDESEMNQIKSSTTSRARRKLENRSATMSLRERFESSELTKQATIPILILLVILNLIELSSCGQDGIRRRAPSDTEDFGHYVTNRDFLNSNDALRSRNFIFSQAAQTTTTQPATIGQEQPDFSEPIGNQTVALGRDAQLSCKIENLGNFRTAWLRVEDKGILTIHNNIITRNYRFGLISNDNGKNFILTIKQVQASDKGGYMCQINSNPMKYAIGYLDVLMPPVFEDSPTVSSSSGGRVDENNLNGEPATTINPSQVPNSLISAREGTNVTLTCKANGHPQPVITWRREDNGPILINNSNNQLEEFQKLEGSSVHLGQVSKMSSGAYLCIASNGVQPSISRRLVLDVQFSPIIMLPQKEIGAYVNQDRIKLTCIIESNPVSSYYWVKVPNSSSNRAAIVSNSNGDSIVDSLNLNDEDDLTLLEHERITNSDKYEIVVNKNDAVANSSEKRELLLIIKSLNKHDFGSYKCLAKNSLGLQSNTIQLYQLTPSSFSLNNMFRGSPIEAEGNQDKQQHQQNDQQPDEEAENSGSGVRKQSGQARTYTRSSWFQRPFIGRGESLTPSKAILDSQSSSPASSASAPSANLLFQLFLLSACIPVALLAQIVNLLYKN